MTATSPELQTQIALWRSKALDGTLTLEEMRQSTALIRAGRIAAATASAKALKAAGKKAPKAPPPDASSLLKGLMS